MKHRQSAITRASRLTIVVMAAIIWSFAVLPATAQQAQGSDPRSRVSEAFTGDFDQIVERRLLRVLISHSQTNYFIDFGTKRGFEYELLRQYEEHLNKGRPLSKKIIVAFVPVPLEKLLDELEAGRGDIAAGGLTVNDNRRKRVAFSAPYIPNVEEVVVTRAGGPTVARIERPWLGMGCKLRAPEHQARPGTRLVAPADRPPQDNRD